MPDIPQVNPWAAPGFSLPQTASAPTPSESFRGPHDALLSPSDSVSAAGPTRYVVLVNSSYAIYDKTVAIQHLLSTGPLATFTTVRADLFGLFDPQIMWDPDTNRFYYAMDNIVCGGFIPCQGAQEDTGIAWGFSKTAEPDNPTDWCHYFSDFGVYGTSALFPDYPKLGDTKDFLLIGVNVYDDAQQDSPFVGSDVAWIRKPPAGAGCPSGAAFRQGVVRDVRSPGGKVAFTPVPANQIDGDHTGYITANVDLGEPGGAEEAATGTKDKPKEVKSGDSLTLFTVRANRDGTANIPRIGRRIPVPAYREPPAAPQKGSLSLIDTLDGRLTNAQEVVDPNTHRPVLYTQHTVAGGAGAMVRWYRIDPERGTAVAFSITHPRLFVYNAAISTDRLRNGATKAFGDAVVIGLTTSSSSSYTAVGMVSKVGGAPASPIIHVHRSYTTNQDFTCFGDHGEPAVCRWGDYSAASPDPAASPKGPHGIVWIINMWNGQGEPITGSNYWRTWNWAVRP